MVIKKVHVHLENNATSTGQENTADPKIGQK